MPIEQREAFDELMSLLRAEYPGVTFDRQETLVRGLDYYNGTCFEVKLDEPSNQIRPPLQEMEELTLGKS